VISVLLACAVCFDNDTRMSKALLDMTVFLSLVPLGMIVGGGWYAWRRVSAHEAGLPPHPDA